MRNCSFSTEGAVQKVVCIKIIPFCKKLVFVVEDEAGAHQYTSTAVAMRALLHAVLSHLECACEGACQTRGFGC